MLITFMSIMIVVRNLKGRCQFLFIDGKYCWLKDYDCTRLKDCWILSFHKKAEAISDIVVLCESRFKIDIVDLEIFALYLLQWL